MKLSSFEQDIENQFDCLSKKVFNAVQKNYRRGIGRRLKHETLFCDYSELKLAMFGIMDEYACDYTVFNVLDMEIRIYDERLSVALEKVDEKKRNILLLSYFMDISDAEIGEILSLARSTVYRQRTSTLEAIKKIMEDLENEETE